MIADARLTIADWERSAVSYQPAALSNRQSPKI